MKVATVSVNTRHPLRNWIVGVLLLTAATAGGFLLDHHVSLTSQAMLYVLAVVIASYTLHWVPSLVCAVGAVTAFNFFFVPPRWTFEVDSREHLIALFAMLLVALVISHLAAALRRETETAHRNEQRARQLQTLATELSSASTPQEVLALGQSALDATFDGPCVLALRQPGGEPDLAPGQAASVGDGMQCCMREAAVLGPGTGRWPGLNAWYLPETLRLSTSSDSKPALSGRSIERLLRYCTRPLLAMDQLRQRDATGLPLSPSTFGWKALRPDAHPLWICSLYPRLHGLRCFTVKGNKPPSCKFHPYARANAMHLFSPFAQG